jgi:DNA-binding transcriptional regulator YiaG
MNCLYHISVSHAFLLQPVDRPRPKYPKSQHAPESKEIRLGQKPIDTIVGARLSAIRIAQGVSVARLATALGTTEHQVERYEDGTDRISAAHLLQLCQYFSVSLADFFPRSDPGQDPNVH